MELRKIATVRNAYREKFGIPRQSNLTDIVSYIVFEKDFCDANALRGLEGFSHIWLIWGFSEVPSDTSFHPTVRPPRLGGNTRVGVFATRSPMRPNPIGLSSVRLKAILQTDDGPVLEVLGADILDGSPVYDIKPYLREFDSHADAVCGFTEDKAFPVLEVRVEPKVQASLRTALGDGYEALLQALSQDPRPQYQEDETRTYRMRYSSYDIAFTVRGNVLTVTHSESVR